MKIVLVPAVLEKAKNDVVATPVQLIAAVDSAARAANTVLDNCTSAKSSRLDELERAESALRSCLRSEGDCSRAREEVGRARQRLATAEEAVRIADAAAIIFRANTRLLVREVQVVTERLVRHLDAKIEGVRGVGARNSDGSFPAAVTGAGPTARTGGSGTYKAPGMMPGYAMVPISLIDTSRSTVKGPSDFRKGYSVQDLDAAFEALHTVVLPAVGRGADKRYFESLDAKSGAMGTRSLTMTYDNFLANGSEAIRLAKQLDGSYLVANGQHRIWVASITGRSHVPALIEGS